MSSIRQLCLSQTILTEDEALIIEDLARNLQFVADVTQSDMFIDCPTADKNAALVVAQAHPSTFPSLYRTTVVGQLAYARNEPAVLYTLVSGYPVMGWRGISQEQIAIQQNVVPIRSRQGKVIGALIMEHDISEKIEQEQKVERLKVTTEQLSQTLLEVAMSEGGMPAIMHEGIVLLDDRQLVTYTNPRALDMLRSIGNPDTVEGLTLSELFGGRLTLDESSSHSGMFEKELQFGSLAFVIKGISVIRDQKTVGVLLLLRDVSDLMEKDKQLTLQSAVIKEIHHRVKNNLQTVSSLLRLQMRRTRLPEVEQVYRDSINRINSIAVIHEMLAFEGTDSIPFRDVVDRIVKNVIASTARPEQQLQAQLIGDPVDLPSDKATTMALIVNELIQNAVIHGFEGCMQGKITIEFHRSPAALRVTVTDNGKGFDPEAMRTDGAHNRLGLKIVEMLVGDNLNGQLTIHSNESGSSLSIEFPLASDVRKGDGAP
jgi:two-component sensor histidine kinase